jgi:hypothetical protein
MQPVRQGKSQKPIGSPLCDARCFLSLPSSRRSGALTRREGGRERIKVRGNGANSNLGYRAIPGPVELGKSAGGAGDFLNDTELKPGHEK